VAAFALAFPHPAQADDAQGSGGRYPPLVVEVEPAGLFTSGLAGALEEALVFWLSRDRVFPAVYRAGGDLPAEHLTLRVSVEGYRVGRSEGMLPQLSWDGLLKLEPHVAEVSLTYRIEDGQGRLVEQGNVRGKESRRGEVGEFDHPAELAQASLLAGGFAESRLGRALRKAAAQVVLALYQSFPLPERRVVEILADGRVVVDAGERVGVWQGDNLYLVLYQPVELSPGRVEMIPLRPIARLVVRQVKRDYSIAVVKWRERRYLPRDILMREVRVEFKDDPILRRYRRML